MNPRFIRIAISLLSIVLLMAIGLSCGKGSTQSHGSAGFSLLSYTDCKVFIAKYNIPGIPEETCLEYIYDDTGTLYLKHINAVFNCCLDSISATMNKGDSVISIVETEHLLNGGCHCICFYDLEYRLDDIAPGIYSVEISPAEEYSDAGRTFVIDISEPVIDTVCLSLNMIVE